MGKYKDWEILNELPDGWKVDKTAGSPAPNTVFITNGKSVLNGQKRALLRVEPVVERVKEKPVVSKMETTTKTNDEPFIFPAKTVNTLARKKFQEQLLKEITFDLMVCEIEGWDKKEYIKELRKMLNIIDLSSNKKQTQQATMLDLFGSS